MSCEIACSQDNETATMKAAAGGHSSVVNYLVEANADVCVTNIVCASSAYI